MGSSVYPKDSNPLKNALRDGINTDVTFVFDDKTEIKAHKMVLCVWSTTFRFLFLSKNFEENESNVVQIANVSREHFLEFLEFIYEFPNEITITNKKKEKVDLKFITNTSVLLEYFMEEHGKIKSLFELANKYEIEGILKMCINILYMASSCGDIDADKNEEKKNFLELIKMINWLAIYFDNSFIRSLRSHDEPKKLIYKIFVNVTEKIYEKIRLDVTFDINNKKEIQYLIAEVSHLTLDVISKVNCDFESNKSKYETKKIMFCIMWLSIQHGTENYEKINNKRFMGKFKWKSISLNQKRLINDLVFKIKLLKKTKNMIKNFLLSTFIELECSGDECESEFDSSSDTDDDLYQKKNEDRAAKKMKL